MSSKQETKQETTTKEIIIKKTKKVECPCIICNQTALETNEKYKEMDCKYMKKVIRLIVKYGKEEGLCFYRMFRRIHLMYNEGYEPANSKEEKLLEDLRETFGEFNGDDDIQIFNMVFDEILDW